MVSENETRRYCKIPTYPLIKSTVFVSSLKCLRKIAYCLPRGGVVMVEPLSVSGKSNCNVICETTRFSQSSTMFGVL